MELATNTFSKGLLMDTNPMVLGTDTLTDCLNGTLITMNGNEVILLNDMGNRRVNNAFLPSGYLPVGMKEYGGIIYVAAYNPITNKSLIGSFPSPLRKVDSNNDLSGQFNFNSFNLSVEMNPYLGIKVLKTDSFMIPLTKDKKDGKDISLRAGDKFSLYSPNLYGYSENRTTGELTNVGGSVCNDLSNYCNTATDNTKRAFSPKNKKYTISIGILNSQNEFVDITKTLCRWDENSKMISYDSSYSDIYKFNDGYFISKEFNNGDLVETIADANFIKSRQKMAANTYAYKLIGPMYAKITLNHIERFNYNIYGVYEDVTKEINGENITTKEATLWIEGYLTYNCPDGEATTYSPGDDNYQTYEEIEPSFNGFDLIAGGEALPFELEESENTTAVYDPATNLYTAKIVKKYTGITPNREGTDIFDYVLGVNAGDFEDAYIQGLSNKGSIDLSLLGSGKLNLTNWQYYTADDRVILSFVFSSYPRYGEKFSNLTFNFIPISLEEDPSTDTTGYTLTLPEVYNGKLTVEILFGSDSDNEENKFEGSDSDNEENKFEAEKLYRVQILYNSSEDENLIELEDLQEYITTYKKITTLRDSEEPSEEPSEEVSPYKVNTRWLLTTKLFNQFYNDFSIPDFCKSKDKDFTDKMKITLEVLLNVKSTKELNTEVKINKLIVQDNSDIKYEAFDKYIINYEHGISTVYIPNKELYPCEITEGENNIEVKSLESESDPEKENISPTIIGGDSIPDINWVKITDSEDKTKTTISATNYFIATNNLTYPRISNTFDKLNGDPLLNVISQGTNDDTQFCGVAAGFDNVEGGEDGHLFDFISHNHPVHHIDDDYEGSPDDDIPENGLRITDDYSDEVWKNQIGLYKFRDWEDRVFLEMDAACPHLMFTYLFVDWNSYSSGKILNWRNDWRVNLGNYSDKIARVWWRSRGGKWAWFMDCVVNDCYANETAIKTYINNTIGTKVGNYVYCMYNGEWSNSDQLILKVAGNDYKYNSKYSFTVTSTLSYGIKSGETIKITSLKIGNLDFEINLPGSLNKKFITEVESSLDFLNLIEEYLINKGEMRNVYIHNNGGNGAVNYEVIWTDNNGNPLNPNYVYILLNNQLVKIENSTKKFYVDTETLSSGGENLLLYVDGTVGTPTYKYNLNGHSDGDNATSIDFSGIQIVKLPGE